MGLHSDTLRDTWPRDAPDEHPAPAPPDLSHATPWTVLRSIRDTGVAIVQARHALIIATTMVLLMLWGFHGGVDLLGAVFKGWTGPGSTGNPQRARLIPGVPWDQEWISFAIGAALLLGVPAALIKFVFKERLSDYGLGLPKKGRGRYTLWSTVLLAAIGFPAMCVASHDPGMRATYPFFRNFASLGAFLTYELGYAVFFLVIEFVFRGYLLFGLYGAHHPGGVQGVRASQDPPVLSHYAILLSMLSYTAWHLGKPLQELWGTLLWGVVTGTMVLTSGTLWHVFLVHWLMNVFLDYRIWTTGGM